MEMWGVGLACAGSQLWEACGYDQGVSNVPRPSVAGLGVSSAEPASAGFMYSDTRGEGPVVVPHMDLAVDGLIFDLDNTLFDFESAFAGVARNFYEQHLRTTTSISGADAVAMMIRWDDDLHAATQYVPDLKTRRFERWLSEWPDTGLDIAALTGWYDDEMDQQMQPDPEVNRFLAHLIDRKVPWGIVSNGPSRMQRHKCQALGLDQISPFIIISEEVGCAKPDPRIFRYALDATGLPSPEQIMFVGDNPATDIAGARRFGMRTAWVRRGRRFPADLQPPDCIVDSVDELRHIVDAESNPETAPEEP